METTIPPQEALQQYREASQRWLSLRNEQNAAQLRLRALLLSADKPANCAWQVEILREKLEVLEKQISCTANDSLYAQRSVVDTCVDNALSDFMANSGKTLTSALAPYLNGPLALMLLHVCCVQR